MAKVWGYARVSTKKQDAKRQEDNIKFFAPDAVIYSESFTGTTLERPEFEKMMKRVKSGDTIIFDEISRMSREADEGFALYKELYENGVNLVFLKERALDTDNFKAALNQQLAANTGNEVTDYCIEFINGLLMKLAEQQIKAAFAAAEHEVEFIHKRTADGMKAHHAGDKIAEARTGKTYTTKKSALMKDKIMKMSKDFNGNMSDKEIIETLKITRNTYYKYKAELKNQ